MVRVRPTMKFVTICDAHAFERLDLLLDDGLGQPELGDAVDHDAARLVEGLEYRHLMPGPPGVGRGDDPART